MTRPYARPDKNRHTPAAAQTAATVIAIGKRLGFSLDEMNETTTQGFLDILQAYHGDAPDVPRRATGADADAFFG